MNLVYPLIMMNPEEVQMSPEENPVQLRLSIDVL